MDDTSDKREVLTGLRKGYTTGSCAAAAAKAAAYILLLNNEPDSISLMTPSGAVYEPDILDISRDGDSVSCAVRKDGGDDPDITDGLLIYARVSICGGSDESDAGIREPVYDESEDIRVVITGGKGVGTVTKPGLDQPVGNPAINSVPRMMIETEVRAVATLAGYSGDIEVEISVPDGERIGVKTFNPRLGIEGGISIIGTSGIVEPMSTRALTDTIRLELRQRRELGYDTAVIVPGNYGRELVLKEFGYDIDRSVRCSNYIGETVDMAMEMGYRRLLLAGHIGKLIKVAGGIMNTHSREADCRMELLTAITLIKGGDALLCREIMGCVTTEEGIRLIADAGLITDVMAEVTERISRYLISRMERDPLRKAADWPLPVIDSIVFDNERGILGMSRGIDEWRQILADEMKAV